LPGFQVQASILQGVSALLFYWSILIVFGYISLARYSGQLQHAFSDAAVKL